MSEDTEQIDAVRESESTSTAPYMSFAGFKNLLDRLKRDGVPQVFDKSFFGAQSGSLTAQIRGTLAFFDLIDADKKPTDALIELANVEEVDRVNLLRSLAEQRFEDAIKLGENNGTQGQLYEVFREYGLTGATVTKAVAFYMGLAEYTNLPLSPFFKKPRFVTKPRKGTARKKITGQQQVTPPTPPAAQTGSIEGKKAAYIDMLMKLAETGQQDGKVQESLLDRIERALGYEPAATTTSETAVEDGT